MLKAIIVDDEAPAIELLQLRICQTKQLSILASYQDPFVALQSIIEMKPDVVFLDIDMPGMNGLELAERLTEANMEVKIIFVTAYNQFALDAFRVNALHYLLKPASLSDIKETVARLQKKPRVPRDQRDAHSASAGLISCFGGFEVYTDSSKENCIKWRTAKAEELFACLFARRGQNVPKWELCDALWPDLAESKVDTHLHTTVYQARKVLQQANLGIEIRFRSGSYTLVLPAAIASDVAEFETIVSQQRRPTKESLVYFERLLTLYQHDYLYGKDYLWALPQQEHYRIQFIRCALQLAEFYMQIENTGQALNALRKILEISPLDETAHEKILEIFRLHQHRAAFIKHYTAMATLFKQELGIEPKDELRVWYEEIING